MRGWIQPLHREVRFLEVSTIKVETNKRSSIVVTTSEYVSRNCVNKISNVSLTLVFSRRNIRISCSGIRPCIINNFLFVLLDQTICRVESRSFVALSITWEVEVITISNTNSNWCKRDLSTISSLFARIRFLASLDVWK